MNNHPSTASIEQELSSSELHLSKNQYIANLKTQCAFKDNALKTAECLIAAYKRQNEELRSENHSLKEECAMLKEESSENTSECMLLRNNCKKYEEQIGQLRKEMLKYTNKINQLLQKSMKAENKIHMLEKQIQAIQKQLQSHKKSYSISKKQKQQNQLKYESVQRKKKSPQIKISTNHKKSVQQSSRHSKQQLQSHFKNYLRVGPSDDSDRQKDKDEHFFQQMKVMEWKLKQKDQQIMMMLRRSRDMQEKYENLMRKYTERSKTKADTADNYSTKKAYISEFRH